MRPVYLIVPAVVAAISLLTIAGCEDKKKNQSKAPVSAPALAQAKPAAPAYVAASAIPSALNPDWDVNTSQRPQADLLVSQAPQGSQERYSSAASAPVARPTAAKSAYRMHYEARTAGTAATASAPAASKSLPVQRVTAEIDADLVATAQRAGNAGSAGLGHTGDGVRHFDFDGPEIGRDVDAPKFTMSQPATKHATARPVARATATKQVAPVVSSRRANAAQMPEVPEIGYVSLASTTRN